MSGDLRPDPALAARAAAEAPTLRLDHDDVLAMGRRYVRRRRTTRVAAGFSGLAAAVVLAVVLSGVHRPTPPPPAIDPTPTLQQPRPLGDGVTTSVASGVDAVNRPGGAAPAIGALWRLAGEQPASMLELGLTSSAGRLGLVTWTGPEGPTGAMSFAYGASYTTGSEQDGGQWTWTDSVQHSGLRISTPSADGVEGQLEVAVVPTDLPDPRVLLWSTDGLETEDGDHPVAVDLPTYAAPDGHLLATAWLNGPLIEDFGPATSGIVFVGSDGRVVQAPCDELVACPLIGAVPGLAAAVAAAGGQVDTASAAPATVRVEQSAEPAARTRALAPGVDATVDASETEDRADVGTFGGSPVALVTHGSGTSITARLVIDPDGAATAAGPAVAVDADPVHATDELDAPGRGTFAFGTVPSELTAARVFYASKDGFRLADGTLTHLLEVPKFGVAYSTSGLSRVDWYVVGVTGDAAERLRGTATAILFGTPDGRVVPAPCGAACSDLATASVAAVQSLLAHPAPWATASGSAAPSAPEPVVVAQRLLAAAGPFTVTGSPAAYARLAELGEPWRSAGRVVELGTFDGVTVRLTRQDVSGATVAVVDADRTTAGSPDDYGRSEMVLADGFGYAGLGNGDDVWVGTVPRGTQRVFIYTTGELTGTDGTRTHVVELPTFTLPRLADAAQDGDQRWFATVLPRSVYPDEGQLSILFGGADGTVVYPDCPECSSDGPAPRAVRALMAQPTPTFARLTTPAP